MIWYNFFINKNAITSGIGDYKVVKLLTHVYNLIVLCQKIEKAVAVVTGSSTGIGFETSLALARKGIKTCATMRDTQKSVHLETIAREENLPIKVFEMNVHNDNSVSNAIQKMVNEYGRIDILVNNAGYGLFGALEDFTILDFKKTI